MAIPTLQSNGMGSQGSTGGIVRVPTVVTILRQPEKMGVVNRPKGHFEMWPENQSEIPMDLTPAAKRALEIALALADIRPAWPAGIRLVRALLEEEEGVARGLLVSCGLDIGTFLSEFSWSPDPGPTAYPAKSPDGPQLFANWGRLLRQARWISKELGDPGEISSEHLIASLLLDPETLEGEVISEEPSHPSRILTRHGLDLKVLARTLRPGSGKIIPLDEPLFDGSLSNPDWSGQTRFDIPPEITSPIGNGNGLARLIDACANRAREGLRVVEDHARFFLNSPELTRGLKEIRHDFQRAMETLPPEVKNGLLVSRDVSGDVGTTISTPTEMARSSPAMVAIANLKRVQETLRSLEEYSKCFQTPAAGIFESLRYRSYKLEQILGNQNSSRSRLQQARLYLLVTAEACTLGFEKTTRMALEGGVDIIQSREKRLPDSVWLEHLHQLRKWTNEAGALLIVNDRADLACLCGADGVHTGQEDLSVPACRSLFQKNGTNGLVGTSTHTVSQLRDAGFQGADYAGVGPVFPSQTKEFETFAGLQLVQSVRANLEIPWFALGGIQMENLEQVTAAGAKRIAVSHCLLSSREPDQTARELKRRLGA